jgi:hypothetical protein
MFKSSRSPKISVIDGESSLASRHFFDDASIFDAYYGEMLLERPSRICFLSIGDFSLNKLGLDSNDFHLPSSSSTAPTL